MNEEEMRQNKSDGWKKERKWEEIEDKRGEWGKNEKRVFKRDGGRNVKKLSEKKTDGRKEEMK